MRVTIYQPQYFPRLHYFNRILNSDIFVILSSAQYTKNLKHLRNGIFERHKSFQSDALIKYPSGIYYLTVPIKHGGQFPLNETQISYSSDWAFKHISILNAFYKKSQNINYFSPLIEELLYFKYRSLADLNIKTIFWAICQIARLKLNYKELTVDTINEFLASNKLFRLRNIFLDPELGVYRPEGLQKGTEWTANICEKLGATEYYHGKTAEAGYMDTSYYAEKKIKLISQNWNCQEYKQQFTNKIRFIANLSIIDLLNNVNIEQALEIIGVEENKQYAFA